MPARGVLLLACLPAAFAISCSSPPSASGNDGGTTSPCVSAHSCPTNVPSYQTTIAPILQTTCIVGCHTPTGTAGFPENTYTEVYNQRGAILSQVAVCQMPPLNGPVMSDAERVALTGWLECGAPDN
jgi:hypothetical protein